MSGKGGSTNLALRDVARRFLRDRLFATPSIDNHTVTPTIRATLLATLVSSKHTLLYSGIASGFVAVMAIARLHTLLCFFWLICDMALVGARWGIIRLFEQRAQRPTAHPWRWALRYAPFAIGACLVLGLGTMMCLMSGDAPLATLAIMVTAGMLGGIASRNAVLPVLACFMILCGVVPIGVGAAMAPGGQDYLLIPPTLIYLITMSLLVKAHYRSLVALMVAKESHVALAARFDAAVTHIPHGLCTLDHDGRVVFANEKAADLFGLPRAGAARSLPLPLDTSFPMFIDHVCAARFNQPFREYLSERCQGWLLSDERSLDINLSQGAHLQLTRTLVADGSMVIIIEDISERRSIERELLHRAQHDALTGLPNRRYFSAHMNNALQENEVRAVEALSVMCLDLDGFKLINDRFGHRAGDEVLQIVSARVKHVLRADALFSRLGGDEFAIALPSSDRTAVGIIASRLIKVVSEPYRLDDGAQVGLSLSIGIAFAIVGETADQLTDRADRALYAAKAAGKSTFCFADA